MTLQLAEIQILNQ